MFFTSTIAALATAPGQAGVAVIRVSGPLALETADKLCPKARKELRPSALPANSFRLYRLHDPRDGSLLDQALVLVFRAPHSFTGEDVVELQVHGGRAVSARILDALFSLGVEQAGPGEFSRRAFLNGRISLDEAEGIMELVAARSDRAARAAAELLTGSLGSQVNAAYDALVTLCADLEATLDFSDEDIDGLAPPAAVEERIDQITAKIDSLAAAFHEGRLLREGALVVLTGPTNAGKSTLFNCLLGSDRAIVADIPGTTRDSIEETLLLSGIPIRLVDTAGLRDASSPIEREGIRRAHELLQSADLILQLTDAAELANATSPAQDFSSGFGTALLKLCTKADLLPEDFTPPPDTLLVSSKTGLGIQALRQAILDALGVQAESSSNAGILMSERHSSLLKEASSHLADARSLYALHAEESAVPVASSLRLAALALGSITGRTYSEDLLDSVFSSFCIGK